MKKRDIHLNGVYAANNGKLVRKVTAFFTHPSPFFKNNKFLKYRVLHGPRAGRTKRCTITAFARWAQTKEEC